MRYLHTYTRGNQKVFPRACNLDTKVPKQTILCKTDVMLSSISPKKVFERIRLKQIFLHTLYF